MKKHLLFGIILLISILCTGIASALPLIVDNIEVDGVSATSRLSLERGETYEVDIIFTPTEDIEDMEIEAFIAGYEYNHDEKISDSTPSDDYDADVTYKEELEITIPKDVEEDNYKLRIIFSDRDADELVQSFSLKLDPVRDAMEISDIILSQTSLESGNMLTAVIRVANFGQSEEEDVRVEITIPQLGLGQVTYIDEVDEDDEESSEEMYLRIPKNAKSGVYNLDVKVEYNRKHESTEDSVQISIHNKEETVPKSKTVLMVGSQLETASYDQPAVYPITITNSGKSSQVFTLSLEGISGWADARISPSSAVILQPNEISQLAITLTPNKSAEGTKVFTLTVGTGEKTLSQIPMTVNILKSSDNTILAYMAIAAIFAIALVALASLKLNFRKVNKNTNTQSKKQVNTYY